MSDKYITPTKKNPVFTAECDWFGYVPGIYKDHLAGNCISPTFGLYFKDAVNALHEWIEENPETLTDYPKCRFTLCLVDGSLNKSGDSRRQKVYTISARKAKKLLIQTS